MERVIVIIPARLASTRLPGKMLEDVDGMPLIARTYQSAVKIGFGEVVVACDCVGIKNAIEKIGGKAILTNSNLPSGTDRVFSAAKDLNLQDDDIVVNLQGDHPYLDSKFIEESVCLLKNSEADIATPIVKITDDSYKRDSVVKVAANFYNDKYAHALYFSRALIPNNGPFYQHVGIYVYRMRTLKLFVNSKQTELEKSEKLEQLRALEIGLKIDTVLIQSELPISVDTKEDLLKARNFMKNLKTLMLVCALSGILSSCAPLIIGSCVGGIAGISLRNREGLSGTISDNTIHAKLVNRLAGSRLVDRVEVVVKHGRVLLIGFVENGEDINRIIEIAKGTKGVKEVINEIKVGRPETMEKAAADACVTSRIKTSMLTDSNIHSLNFNITTYNKVVYVLGFAENRLELDSLIRIARSTSGVEKVITYVDVEGN